MGTDQPKVISLDQVRREHGMRLATVEKPFELGAWSTRLLTNGTVELHLNLGRSVVAQALDEKQFEHFIDGLQRTRRRQRLLLDRLRSSHLWVARPHPTSPALRLIIHDNKEAPFRRATAGKRQTRGPLPTHTLLMTTELTRVPCVEVAKHEDKAIRHWHCDACGGCLIAGAEMWVEEKGKLGHERRWPDAKLCAKCVEPRKGGVEVVGGEDTATSLSSSL